MISVNGKTSLLPFLKVLDSLGIPTKILADLDFIGNCHDFDLIDTDNFQAFEDFRVFIASVKDLPNLIISDDHVKDCSSLKQIGAKKFRIIANLENSSPFIEQLHNKLKEKRIFIWKCGDIESVYGFSSKKEDEWNNFNRALLSSENDISNLVAQFEHLSEAVQWLN